jgi:hypothetical protein
MTLLVYNMNITNITVIFFKLYMCIYDIISVLAIAPNLGSGTILFNSHGIKCTTVGTSPKTRVDSLMKNPI